MTYKRIPDDEYKKLLFQLTSQMREIFGNLKIYGLDAYVDADVNEAVRLAENFGMALRGWGKPIHILKEPKKRITE